MKKIILFSFFIIPFFSFAGNGDTLKFWVQLKDKHNSPYSIKHPEKFLSKKAIERRKKFHIAITEEDFPVNPAYTAQVVATGVKILNTSRWLNGISVQTADNNKIKQLMALPFVKEVDMVGVYSGKDNSKMDYLMEFFMSIGADEEKDKKKKKKNIDTAESTYGKGLTQLKMLNGVAMHKMGFTGNGVTIAVLDGGFMNVHKIKTFARMFENGQLLGTWDFVNQDSNVYDDNNHGMNVLSCMAAYTPGEMVGTAPDASFWLLRTEDANTEYKIEEYNWASGAEFADSAGVDVINSSLGYNSFDDETTSYTYRDLNGKTSPSSIAASIAAKKGILICNAAGNEGDGEWGYMGTPGDADGIITVGGVNPDSTHASFSSYGPTADGRIKPTVSAQATEAIVASVSDGFYGSQGTSFASPILCGMVACLRQANPGKTVKEIIDAIQFSATQFDKPDTVLGYGIPDFVLANRILGGDKNFDYKKAQVVPNAPGELSLPFNLTVYNPKNEPVRYILNGKSIKEEAKVVNSLNGFYRSSLLQDPDMIGGYDTIDVYIGKNKFSVMLR